MEINPAGVIVAFALLLIVAVFVAMFILLILQALHVIRFKKNSHFILSSIGLGIILLVVFWFIKTRPGKRNEIPAIRVDTVPDTTIRRPVAPDTAVYK